MEKEFDQRPVAYVYERPDPVPDYWGYSDVELARCCRLIAEGHSGASNALLCGEAVRLLLLWRESLMPRRRRGEEYEDGVALLWSLRRRTIQILVRLSLQGLLFVP
ncbi:hypothetical protein DYQ86_13815 [Acidobacteria bacterium AB60]|nr:hypothetical protein DYQ86_13815 [Acidobacteria bacterium AB60]